MSNFSQTDTVKEMDAKISSYCKLLETVSDREKPNLQTKLLGAKLMREKFVAMTAFAKAQSIFAEMEVLVAETNLKNACEQLDLFKKELDEKTEKKLHKSKATQKSSTTPQTSKTRDSTPKDRETHSTKKVSQRENEKSKSDSHEKSKKRKNSGSNQSKSKKSKVSSDNKNVSLTLNTITSSGNNTNDVTKSKTNNNSKHSSSSHSKSKKSKTSSENKTDSLTFNTLSPIKSNNKDALRPRTEIYNTQLNYDDEDTIILEDLSKLQHANSNQVLTALPDVREAMSSKMQILFEDDQFNCVKMETPSDMNKSTEELVNNLFTDILNAKMKISNKSESDNNISKTMLRKLLEKC